MNKALFSVLLLVGFCAALFAQQEDRIFIPDKEAEAKLIDPQSALAPPQESPLLDPTSIADHLYGGVQLGEEEQASIAKQLDKAIAELRSNQRTITRQMKLLEARRQFLEQKRMEGRIQEQEEKIAYQQSMPTLHLTKHVRWEYKKIGQQSEDELNKLGDEGWELVAAYVQQDRRSLIFKRPKQ